MIDQNHLCEMIEFISGELELHGPGEDDRGSLAAYARLNGLANALERHCELTAPKNAIIKVNIADETWLSESLKETLLRISQEALANAFRHGDAKEVSISLDRDERELCLLIKDDGRGLQQESALISSSTRIGLASMRARRQGRRKSYS